MNTDNFFPTADYEVPTAPSSYMKLKKGENTFRVLSSAVVGYEYWNTDDKPVRSKAPYSEMPRDIRKDSKIKHFWAFVVWNYNENMVQILQVSQKSIQEAIKALVDNSKWGNPKKYDITVARDGEGLETSYTVMPNPHSDTSFEIDQAFEAKPANLEALFSGGDPFAK